MAIEFAVDYLQWWQNNSGGESRVSAHTARQLWRASHIPVRPPMDHIGSGVSSFAQFDDRVLALQSELGYSTDRMPPLQHNAEIPPVIIEPLSPLM